MKTRYKKIQLIVDVTISYKTSEGRAAAIKQAKENALFIDEVTSDGCSYPKKAKLYSK